MSQPPSDYTQHLGSSAQHSYPFTPAPQIAPASSFYQTSQEPSPSNFAGNFAALNGSFEYNGSRIPGLGMSTHSRPALPPSPYQIETRSSTKQPTYGELPSGRAPSIAQQPATFAPQREQQPLPKSLPPQLPSNEASEGELSEGQFEDLYEARIPSNGIALHTTGPARSGIPHEDPTSSTGDADGSSIYDTGSAREDVVVGSVSASQPAIDGDDDYEPGEYDSEYQSRDKSRSYSPHLSPKEARPATTVSTTVTTAVNGPAPLSQSQLGGQAAVLETQVPSDHGKIVPHASVSSSKPVTSSNASQLPYKSVLEAKKKAQEAILGLWPHKVRYQNYLDEGLDPQIVKALFTELGLDVPSSKSAAPAQKSIQSPVSQANKEITTRVLPKSVKHSTSPPVKSTKTTSDKNTNSDDPKAQPKKSAQEERKDKIARMLAEKSKKNSTQPIPTAAAILSTTAAPASVSEVSGASDPVKIKLRAQNNQRILEKLAALKKQQGKKSDHSEVTVGSTAFNGVDKQTDPTNNVVASPQQAGLIAQVGGLGTPTPASQLGLSVSLSPNPTPIPRTTKRPIASDFDGYSSGGNALKRTRTQETLIIDVSDDEDVEMDLGSPTEAPSTGAIPHNLPRQNSLASFPPLTHTRSWRGQKSGPTTPAAGTPGRGQLNLLKQQILEAKKMIAEAEKKKAAGSKSNGVSTPSDLSPSQTPRPAESMRLPKPSEAAQAEQSERRNRIASYHIPVLDAALKEKQEKLQRLQTEAAQLEAEVQAALSERQKLTAEMEILDVPNPRAVKTDHLKDDIPVIDNNLAEINSGALESNSPDPEPAPIDTSNALSEDAAVASHESSPEQAHMDIDSDSSNNSGGSDSAISTASTKQNISLSSVPVSNGSDNLHAQPPTTSESPISQTIAVETNEPGTKPPTVDVEEHTQTDADTPMQISDAEEEDHPVSIIPQISAPGHAHNDQAEDGEVHLECQQPQDSLLINEQIPDEDPSEPSPAQAPEPALHAATMVAHGEVQLRASQEPRLLTHDQGKSQAALSAEDLLSYQSPLRYFHAYKFHPQYAKTVAGGLKSMTYSSKIDATRPICPSAIDGGQCPNGSSCEFQHFDKMSLSDSAIIAELGSTSTYTGEQKNRFIEGLKKVLQDLKTSKVKDFDSITKALVQYRADFLGDKSKILPLNDVVI